MLAFEEVIKDNKPESQLTRYLNLMTYLSILPIKSSIKFDTNLKKSRLIVEAKKWRAFALVLADWTIMLGNYICFSL